ncbi:MAG: hypothetical protein H7289_01225 [Mucilaginibacter sp.]|nr:hypothetical protein [Mucilaginibacter sp.]
MKKALAILIFSVSMAWGRTSFAQYKTLKNSPLYKPDTVYFLADTTSVQNYRILTILDDSPLTGFTINCSCLNTEWKYIYLNSYYKKSIPIDEKKFRSLTLTSLPDLITLIQVNNSLHFGDQFTLCMVEPKKHQYIVHTVVNKSNVILIRVE